MRLPQRLLIACLLVCSLGGCAILREFKPAVALEPMTPGEYIALQRGDILTSGQLSTYTAQAIRVTGLDQGDCATASPGCIEAMSNATGLGDERQLSTLAELWLQHAISLEEGDPDTRLQAWMEAVRHAYAYLFFTGRAPGDRAFEDRQTQVRDWYNYAVQEASTLLFEENMVQQAADADAGMSHESDMQRAGWTFHLDLDNVRLPQSSGPPQELLPAASLAFTGLRSIWRRDGFGAELVAVMDEASTTAPRPARDHAAAHGHAAGDRPVRRPQPPAWSEMPSPGITVLFRFHNADLAAVLAADEVQVEVHDPYASDSIVVNGQRVPLAANFTAGYGLWLARSGFNLESLRTLFGREDGIHRPHLYLMQPYDPDRRIILMLHGLASSPEAWVNLANEIQGDEELRRNFQIWQVYYPTNVPVVLNHAAIRGLLANVLEHFDPGRTASASQEIVLIGHSMGGLISRLMVSTADIELWEWFQDGRDIDPERLERIRPRLDPMLRFEPFPGITRTVFIATPHRGTDVAGHTLGRWISRLVRLPLTLVEELGEALQMPTAHAADGSSGDTGRLSNSIDNLDRNDPFVRAAADLPISPTLPYHSIIARTDPTVPLEQSDDGLVPYPSAHLPDALSEEVITSGHSVQQTALAILEIRRILHLDLLQRAESEGRK
ncbi:esterase/lipase family protein [Luteimonas sp. A478]